MRMIRLIFLLITLTGCANTSAVKEHPNVEGAYVAFFDYLKVIDEYGPGVSDVRSRITQDNYKRIWSQAVEEALPKYLTSTGLMPLDCKEIVIISSSMDENGGGSATFYCK